MKLPTLYSKDSHGEIRMWEVSLIRDPIFHAVSRYGLIGGSIQESRKMCLVGSAPASCIEQAQSFCKSLWNKQKGKGYTESKDGEPEGIAPRPMKAHLFNDHKNKLQYPVIVQPKLNGFRCIAIKINGKVSCWSSSGKRFETTSFIEAELNQWMENGQCFDGELYKHKQDFDELSGSIRNLVENNSMAEYHIYDYIAQEMPQYRRLAYIHDLFEYNMPFGDKFTTVKKVPLITALNEEGVLNATSSFISNGYEGAMVRTLLNLYRPKYRSPQMLKVKEFMEEDYKIVDFYEGEGKDEGAVIWEVVTPGDHLFRVRPRGSYSERKILFEKGKNYIGKWLTVKFPKNSESYTKNGIPRFTTGIRIRNEME